MTITQPQGVGERWYMDAVHLTKNLSLVVAREALSRWPEARIFRTASKDISAGQISRFLYEDVFCRWGAPDDIVMDNATQNLGEVSQLICSYGVKRVNISPYHPESNSIVEVGHQTILAALSKLTNGGMYSAFKHIAAVLWAERTTTVSTTGLTPAEVMIGRDAVLPIELEYRTFGILHWGSVKTREELLAMRALALERMAGTVEEGLLRQERLKQETKDYFDRRHDADTRVFKVGDLVLMYLSENSSSHDKKLFFRWKGPYRINEVLFDGASYRLEEMDGTVRKFTAPKKNLKNANHLREVPDETPVYTSEENEEANAEEARADLEAREDLTPEEEAELMAQAEQDALDQEFGPGYVPGVEGDADVPTFSDMPESFDNEDARVQIRRLTREEREGYVRYDDGGYVIASSEDPDAAGSRRSQRIRRNRNNGA